jgi:hypothetical protein
VLEVLEVLGGFLWGGADSVSRVCRAGVHCSLCWKSEGAPISRGVNEEEETAPRRNF